MSSQALPLQPRPIHAAAVFCDIIGARLSQSTAPAAVAFPAHPTFTPLSKTPLMLLVSTGRLVSVLLIARRKGHEPEQQNQSKHKSFHTNLSTRRAMNGRRGIWPRPAEC